MSYILGLGKALAFTLSELLEDYDIPKKEFAKKIHMDERNFRRYLNQGFGKLEHLDIITPIASMEFGMDYEEFLNLVISNNEKAQRLMD